MGRRGSPTASATHPTRPAAHLSVGGTRTHGCARAVLGDRAEAGDAIPPCAARVQREGQGPRQSAGPEGWRPAAAHGGRAYSGGAASPPSRPTGDMRTSDMRAGRSAQTWRFWGELNTQKNRTKAAQCGHLLPQSNGGSESDPSSPSCGAAGHRLPRPRSAGRSACSRLPAAASGAALRPPRPGRPPGPARAPATARPTSRR